MEIQAPSPSFIPKKSLIRSAGAPSGVGVFMAVSIILFIVSLAAFGGAFVYEKFLSGEKARLESRLAKRQAEFEPKLLAELERVDARITVANELLSRHITILPLFDFLGVETLKTIRYKTFSASYPSQGNGSVEVRLTGEALGYEAIALQSDVFAQTKKLSSFVFSNLSPDVTGAVNFDLTASVDPSLLTYGTARAAENQTP